MWEKLPESEEMLDQGDDKILSYRMKVPGGWLVRSIATRYKGGTSVHHVFVADVEHQWQLNKTS